MKQGEKDSEGKGGRRARRVFTQDGQGRHLFEGDMWAEESEGWGRRPSGKRAFWQKEQQMQGPRLRALGSAMNPEWAEERAVGGSILVEKGNRGRGSGRGRTRFTGEELGAAGAIWSLHFLNSGERWRWLDQGGSSREGEKGSWIYFKGRAKRLCRALSMGQKWDVRRLQNTQRPLPQLNSIPINVLSFVSTFHIISFKHFQNWTNKHNLPQHVSNHRKSDDSNSNDRDSPVILNVAILLINLGNSTILFNLKSKDYNWLFSYTFYISFHVANMLDTLQCQVLSNMTNMMGPKG